MAADLKRLDDERALLLAGVSHDLRTPLSRIRLGLEMLDTAGDQALKAGMVQDIQDIDVSIGQFLDFARIAETEQAVPDCDLNALINGTGERYARLGRPLKLNLAPLPPVALRPVAMQRLLNNLIENALRHGGPDVEVVSGREQDRVFLEVLDRGPGIPEDKADYMLRPFTRLDAARGGPGTGLGLAIVDRIARMHGGTVSLLPRAGGGLRARIELPVKTSAG
jgi:two-component system osmolarity sensor histidine kinase EnvZ